MRVFAAASLADVLLEVQPEFARASGHTILLNLGASGTLARQIREGAPADVFFPADEVRVEQLESAGLVLPATRRIVARNTLVVIVPHGHAPPVRALSDLTRSDIRRVALGEPATVPLGAYSRALLERFALWEPLSRKIVPLDNARGVLAAVEAGNADAGIVYRTDALVATRVTLALNIPVDDAPPIRYPAVVLRDARPVAAACAFVEFLGGETAQAVFAKHGFLPPN